MASAEDIIKELEALEKHDREASVTAEQIAIARFGRVTDWHIKSIRRHLRKLIEDGKVRTVRVPGVNVAGQRTLTPAYQVIT